MPEERLEFSDHDQVRTLFGDRDRYLRLIRDELGVDVVLRDGVIRIFGDEPQVRRGREVFEMLAGVLRKTGRVLDADVWDALGTKPPQSAPPQPTSIPPREQPARDADGSASFGERVVDLFERGGRRRPGRTSI